MHELFKTIRLIIILAFSFAVFYYLFSFGQSSSNVIYKVPVDRQEAASRHYNDVYNKVIQATGSATSATHHAEEAVIKIYGEPVIVQKGEEPSDPLEFVKPEKKPPSRLQK